MENQAHDEFFDVEVPDELVEVVADANVSSLVLALLIAVELVPYGHQLVPYVHFVLASELEQLHLT